MAAQPNRIFTIAAGNRPAYEMRSQKTACVSRSDWQSILKLELKWLGPLFPS